MAIDDTDSLNLELGITEQERWEADLKRAAGIAEDTSATINDAFESNVAFASRFGQQILRLEQQTASLARQFNSASMKNYGQDLDFVQQKSREATQRLGELQLELREIESNVLRSDPASIAKGKFDRVTSDIRNEIGFLERQLVSIRQLESSLSQSTDPRTVAPVDFTSTESRNILKLQSELQSLEKNFLEIRNINPGLGVQNLGNQASVAISRVQELRTRVVQLDKELQGQTDKTVISNITTEAKKAENEIAGLKRQLLSLQAETVNAPKPTTSGKSPLSEIAQGLGIPGLGTGLGVAAVVGAAYIGIQKGTEYLQIAIERGTEAIQVNRKLAASASEAGIAYSVLAEKNQEYARLSALSTVKTGDFTAKVAQLVARTAQPERLDTFAKSLLDLGAARGLDSNELVTVVNQIITGQDEAYKKLGIRNPQVLYKEAAQKQDRSVESFSTIEKQIIYQDEILKKGLIFSGAAENRLKSIDGQIDTTKAQFENFFNSLSLNTINSQPFFDLLTSGNALLKQFGDQADDTKKKLSQGISPAALVNENSLKGLNATYEDLKRIANIIETPAFAIIGAVSTIPAALGNKQAQSLQSTVYSSIYNGISGSDQGLFQDQLQQRYNAQLLEIANQKKVAEEQRKALADQSAEDEVRKQSAVVDHKFQLALKRNKTDADAIQQAYNDLLEQAQKDTTGIFFNQQKLEEVGFQAGEAISRAILSGYQKTLSNPTSRIIDFQRGIVDAQSNTKLTDDDRIKATSDFQRAIDTQVQKIQALKKEVQSTLVSALDPNKDNPFVKLFSDLDTALDRTKEKFGGFGDSFVKMMTEMEQAQIRQQIAQTRYLSQVKALDYTQQYEKLKEVPDTQLDGFQRRLEFTKQNVQYIANTIDIDKQLAESKFYSQEYNPNNPKNFDRERFKQLYGGQTFDSNVLQIDDAVKQIQKLNAIDARGVGIQGQAAIADEVLKRIPARDVLLSKLTDPRYRQDAQSLLGIQTDALQTKRKAADEQFQELVQNQVVAEKTRKFAQEKIDLLGRQTGLDKGFTADQVLNITGELGQGELTSSLRSARLQALQIRAETERQKEQEGIDRQKKIVETLDKINTALSQTGVKIDTTTTPLVDINIDNNTGGASSSIRPGPKDVDKRNE